MFTSFAVILIGSLAFSGDGDDAIQKQLKSLPPKLKSPHEAARLSALKELGSLEGKGKPLARLVCQAMMDKSPKVAAEASKTLEKVHPDLHKHLVILSKGADHVLSPNVEDRAKAREDIWMLGADGEAAVPVILAILNQNAGRVADGYWNEMNPKTRTPFSEQTAELAVILDIKTLVTVAPNDAAVRKALQIIATQNLGPNVRQAVAEALKKK